MSVLLTTRSEGPHLDTDATPFRAVAFGPRMPRTLQGAAPALALDDLRSFHLPGGSGSYAERLGGTVQAMYASASDPMLSSAANEMFGAVSTLQKIGVERHDDLPKSGGYPSPEILPTRAALPRFLRDQL